MSAYTLYSIGNGDFLHGCYLKRELFLRGPAANRLVGNALCGVSMVGFLPAVV